MVNQLTLYSFIFHKNTKSTQHDCSALSAPFYNGSFIDIRSEYISTDFKVLFLPNAITEWTAMGDSYASGIGAGDLPQGPDPDKCFRCRNAYPEVMQSGQGSLRPNPDIFNFVACSGATFPEILRYQLSNHDRPGRPSWGDAPEFVTLTTIPHP